jgi:hypothetical protein
MKTTANPNRILTLFLFFFVLAAGNSAYGQKGKKTATPKKPVAVQKGNLSIEAGLVFKNGDVKPVARVEFHLLDADLESIIRDSGLKLGQYDDTYIDRYASLEFATRQYGVVTTQLKQAQAAIKSHIVASVTTDFSGKGKFPTIKTGKYYLYGVGGTAQQAAIWNLSVEIKAGNQSITLDNKNTAKIY